MRQLLATRPGHWTPKRILFWIAIGIAATVVLGFGIVLAVEVGLISWSDVADVFEGLADAIPG